MKRAGSTLNQRDRLIIALLIGVVTAVIYVYALSLAGGDAGDFRHILQPLRAWLAGESPYEWYERTADPIAVPYPFTAILLALPVVWLPDRIAAGVFTGLGSGILAWLVLGSDKKWRLLMFLSWPFVNSLLFGQWAPYATSLFFTSNLFFLVLVKPQLTLPFALLSKPGRLGLILAALLLGLSLILYPTWPFDWLRLLDNYIGFPPLFVLPLGPLLLLALIRWRDKRAWLLVLLAAMPQRMVYDQLSVLLVADNRRQLLFLMLCSWISLPVLFIYGGWEHVPWGWKQWILIESYLPALLVILAPAVCWRRK